MVPSSEEELGALRERAYGPRADIATDPVALQRLRELESARRPPAHAIPPGDTPTPALATPPPAQRTQAPAEPVPAPAEPSPDTTNARTLPPRVIAVWAASLAVAIVIAVVLTLALAPGPTAVVAPGVEVRRITEITLDAGVEWPSGFQAGWAVDTGAEYLGMTIVRMQERGAAASECLLVWVPRTGQAVPDAGSVQRGCRAGAFPARAEVLVDRDAPPPLRQRFAVGTALQFVLQGDRVTVYSDGKLCPARQPRRATGDDGVRSPGMSHNDRDYDIVLLGASGFVGRYTARHLADSAPPGARIAIAGRTRSRLQEVNRKLGVDWPILEVDTGDDAAVTRLAAFASVIATTVGPYRRYGEGVAAACARAGTSYADLAGESVFVARSIERNHDAAADSGTRIVHSCGFDSIPSDLGLGLAHRAAGGVPIVAATLRVRSLRGGVSGGTIDSLRQQMQEARTDADARRLIGDPYALTPGPSVRLPTQRAARWGRERGGWQAPFVMGSYNQQVVQRSNYLTGWGYGQLLQYREVVATGRGVAGFARAAGIAAGTAALVAGLSFPPTRAVLDRFLPAPGSGPNSDAIEHGRFAVDVDAYPVEGPPVRTRIAAPFDPGYGGTGVMLGESALSLAFDDLPDHAGVLTPMVAMGDSLASRLRTKGFDLDVGAVS